MDRLEALREAQADGVNCVETLITILEELSTTQEKLNYKNRDQELRDKVYDMAIADDRRLRLQIAALEAERDQLKTANPHVLVIIDGDGMNFRDELIRKGLDGGRKAANFICDNVLSVLRDSAENGVPSDTAVVVRIIADIPDHISAMVKQKSNIKRYLYEDFYVGLTQPSGSSQGLPRTASVDVINVGKGKEQADHKISNDFQFYKANPGCLYIFLGICHDNGYARLLNHHDAMSNEEIRTKLYLLHSTPVEKEIKAFNLKTVAFSDVFSSESTQRVQVGHPVSPPSSVHSRSSPDYTNYPILNQIGNDGYSFNHAVPDTFFFGHPPLNMGLISTTRTKQRADSILTFSTEDSRAVFSCNPRPCNDFYLQPNGCPRPNCGYSHAFPITPGRKNAMLFNTRKQACRSGLACTNAHCTFGHICQNAPTCTRMDCPFDVFDGHKDGTEVKNPAKGKVRK